MWNKKYYFFFLLLVTAFGLVAQSTETEETAVYQLKWADVPGATGYLLEIRNANGSVVLSEKLSTNFYNASNLVAGVYEHRVGVINKLGKVGSFSEWVSFEVVISRVPALTKESVFSVSKEEKTKTFILEGKDFIDPMKVYILLDGKKIPAKSVVIESSTKAKAIFDIDPDFDTGVYDLVLENPRKKALNVNKRVVLSDSKEKAERFANRQERILKKEVDEDYYASPYWSTIWRSALVPGWGQTYIDGQSWKLYVYPVITLGIAGAYASSYNKFLSARSAYGDAVLLGFLLSENVDTQLFWLLNRNTAQTNFNQAKQELNTVQTGAGVFGLFIVYNLVDAYFSARRNVAFPSAPTGFPVGQENIRVSAKMEKTSGMGSLNDSQFHLDSRYQFEFSMQY
ncbi:hypothetical protein EHQ58_00045 [Leptospira ognonensis]|uniref:DUF5683 domain-containing protein n=1 Tax=Leptospira ognonensis TaxID=2484945 RepID=A0A4R9KFJ7_9LEPT|nr:DUF5683 domain-containing protein [Leptospira ognonensis]TGL63982.1 hypothetical protein EHQ58_00045 [Leptospira ognonensis]